MQRDLLLNPVVRLVICILVVMAVVALLFVLHPTDRVFAAALNFFLLAVLIASVGWGARYAVFLSFLAALGLSWLVPHPGDFHVTDTRVLALLGACLVTGLTASHLVERARRAARRSEEELREAADRFRAYMDHAIDALFVFDEQANIVDANRRACETLGYTREELIGMPLAVFEPGVDTAFLQRIRERLDTGEIFTSETSHRRKDGSLFPVELRIRPFSYGGRRLSLGLARDLTNRKQAEQERERLRQLETDLAHINRVTTMGELTASLAHEVNQPIAAAITNANTCVRWLAGKNPNVEEAQEAAKRIVKDATRAAEIISRIRLLFKKSAPQHEPVNVNEVIEEIIALLSNEAARYRVSIRSHLAPDLEKVMGDRIQLQQVLLNLMMNGIDAMKDIANTRELIIASRRDGDDRILVSVSDTGVGLPPEADRIFNAFFTTKASGTGMGLAISRNIIESHGGRLWASASSSHGAIFCFTLPLNGEAHG